MNSNIEYAADAGYSPVSAAVSYAQCVNVYVPWMLRTTANSVEIVVRELPYALQLMTEACNSLAMPIKFEHDEIVARLAREANAETRLIGWRYGELSMSVANLANDFLECDAALNMSFRDAGSRRFCKPGIINYRLCGCPQGKRASTMNFALSSFSAELHYAALKSRDPDGDSSVLIDTAGYILGPEHGVFVAQSPQGVICVSAFRPVLAKAVANRIAALGHKVAGDAIHLSDLAGCVSFGWIGQDLTVWHASLRSLGAPVKSDESLARTLQDLANVGMTDDIVVPFQSEV